MAEELEPEKDPRAVLEELGEDHPAPDQLLDSFRATFDGLVSFIRAHHIVTIPSDVRPIVEETPPFMRATTTASMDTPGPFETHATEAYFNVTLPDPSMTPAEVEGYMHGFNVGTVISTAVHEAYPGHYVQFLWLPQAPSKVRKLLGANTDVEGWAHYCEQMMLDEGYGQPGAGAKDEREAKFLRLGQLQDALLRNARFIVGIEMHTGKMSIEQAEEFFQKEGYQSKESAVVETKRGAGDPTYLYYTLGKLEIMKLREDVKKKEGAAFTLEKFHDDFLKQGFPPIKIVREAMLGDDSPTLVRRKSGASVVSRRFVAYKARSNCRSSTQFGTNTRQTSLRMTSHLYRLAETGRKPGATVSRQPSFQVHQTAFSGLPLDVAADGWAFGRRERACRLVQVDGGAQVFTGNWNFHCRGGLSRTGRDRRDGNRRRRDKKSGVQAAS